MADLIFTPSGADGFVNDFERQVVAALCDRLPAHWRIAPNFTFKPRKGYALEVDALVFADCSVFVVEAKQYTGRLTGDDQSWELGGRSVPSPTKSTNAKSRALASVLEENRAKLNTEPVVVVPDESLLFLEGGWAANAVHLCDLATWLISHDAEARKKSDTDEGLVAKMAKAVQVVQGKWGERQRSVRRQVGLYEVVETLERDEAGGVFLGRHAQFADGTRRYRLRTWSVSPTVELAGTDRQLRWMFRSVEARNRIGPHPNLLEVLHYEHDRTESEFVEVTLWPEGGSLHRFLAGPEAGASSLAARLAIATGIAEGLKACHAAGVVHRNLQPEAILLDRDRVPKLTDFERAHMEGETTIYSDSRGRTESAFLAPELLTPAGHDASPAADCYALGVLLYQLVTGELPFAGPAEAGERSGRPARLPSEMVAGVDPRVDQLVTELLSCGVAQRRPTADEAYRRLRAVAAPPPQPVQPAALEVAPSMADSNLARAAEPFARGLVLDGKWRLDELLGEGNFAVVWRVHHLAQGTDYAMKIFTGLSDQELALREFNQIRPRMPLHEHLRQVYWLDRLPPPYGNLYMVAELIRGVPLTDWTRGERRMSWPEQRRVAEGLLGALGAVHGAGVIHRDVKPANVLVEEGTGRVLLIDFNVASGEIDFDGGHGTRLYRPSDISRVGWGPHADLFALGIVLFELFFGSHPFAGLSMGEPARSPRAIVGFAGVSEAIVAFFAKALHLQAEHRFGRASEMLAALPQELFGVPAAQAAALPAAVAQPAPAQGAKKMLPVMEAPSAPSSGRSRLSRVLIAGLAVALLGVAGWAVWSGLGGGAEAPPVAPAPPVVVETADAKFDHRGCPEGFVRIPAGSFRMGKEVWEKAGYKDESPVHTVVLTRDLCMQQRETDQREWALLMGSNPSVHSGCGENCPVDSVTWRQAVAFANARSTAEGRPACYEGDRLLGLTCGGYRLPTEAEWEYAARAGEDRTKVVVLPDVAWHKGNARDVPHATGALQPNRWGLYDMLGNVWEWTNDRYGPYEPAAQVDPTGAAQGAIRVRRGGAWNSFPMIARAGNRGNSLSQTQRSDSTGLRLALLPQ